MERGERCSSERTQGDGVIRLTSNRFKIQQLASHRGNFEIEKAQYEKHSSKGEKVLKVCKKSFQMSEDKKGI